MTISIVTPTTGAPELKQAVQSVLSQEYADIEYYVVIDGKEREAKTLALLEELGPRDPRLHTVTLPYPTGLDGFNGHRIFGAAAYLTRGELIAFLDEDNWWDPNHLLSLLQLMVSHNLDWAYSMRKIVDSDGTFLLNDDCENLGIWKACIGDFRHVDTSCYLLKRADAVSLSPIWYKQFRDPSSHTPDAILCNKLVDFKTSFGTPGLYSLNYRLGGTEKSVRLDFFQQGNKIMRDRYPNGLPWTRGPAFSRDHITY
jgi:glycosyltransferase involved in cell wall biosynthesis